MKIGTLLWIALIGLAVVLLVDLISSVRMKSGFVFGIIVLAVFPTVVALASGALMPRAVATLLRGRDLLVPLALVVVADKVLNWLAALPVLVDVLSPSIPIHLLNFSFALSVQFLGSIVLAVTYGTWMTGAVINLVRNGNDNPCTVWSSAMRRFLHVLGVDAIGVGVLMLVCGLLLLLMPVLRLWVLLPMGVFGVVWNFATAAALPMALERKSRFVDAVKTGFAVSLANWHKWYLLLPAQMLLLGLVFISFSHHGSNSNVSFSVNTMWTGGYEADCRWYAKLAGDFRTPTLPVVATLLTLLFGAMAVAIKIAIVQRLQKRDTA